MTATVSPERLSDVIGAIYDCVLNPANWEPVLAVVCREFSFASAILGVQRFPSGRPICQVSFGVEPEWLARIPEFGPEIVELWGGYQRVEQFPLDEPIVNSQAVDRARVNGNRYLQEWFARGMIDAVAMIIARDGEIVGNLGFNRHQEAGAIGETEMAGLRLLAPHFRRAVTIGNLFDMKKIEAATFASVVDRFSFGLVLVDEALGIVHVNPIARAMLSARDPIEARNGVIGIPGKAANAALRRAVRQATYDEAAMGHSGLGIPARRRGGGPCVLHVLPLKRGELRRGVGERATAALFVTPAHTQASLPRDALALLYDLTPAEARVFELICQGVTQAEIANMLGIARSTVKTHLLHVFDKTDCSRQVDLVKLARSLSLPG